MANSVSHSVLVRGARYTIPLAYYDATGILANPTSPDTEFSLDNAAVTDCAEEVSLITSMPGIGFLTLSGAETNGSFVAVQAKGTGVITTPVFLQPPVYPVLFADLTATGGTSSTITLPSSAPAVADMLIGCIVKTISGTGGGGTGGANNQARIITGYTSGRVCTVSPNWEVNPDNTTHVSILIGPEAHGSLAGLVWDQLRADHDAPDTFGEVSPLSDIADAVWETALPGSFTAGQAGQIVGDNLDLAISTRASDADMDTVVTATSGLNYTNTGKVDAAILDDDDIADAVTQKIAAALLDLTAGVETNLTVRQAMRGFASVLMGKSSNNNRTFRDFNDTKNRITATITGANRTTVTRDLT